MSENNESKTLQAGAKAPEFALASSTGETIDLKNLAGKTVVLYFYPKADTPGCTKEACGFRDAIAGYKKLSAAVFGISPEPGRGGEKVRRQVQAEFSDCSPTAIIRWRRNTASGEKRACTARNILACCEPRL